MTYSPGDIIVYEAPLAGRGSNKTAGSRALDIPADVAIDMGLVPTTTTTIGDTTSYSSSLSRTVASPPLLGTRRSPRRPAQTSPTAEYAPMRTPSPSLRAQDPSPITEGIILNIPTPAVPSLFTPPSPEEFGSITASTAVSEGLNLLAPSDEELEFEQEQGENMGLGLGLAGWDDDDLITVVAITPSASAAVTPSADSETTHTRAPLVGLGFDFGMDGIVDDSVIVDELDDIEIFAAAVAASPSAAEDDEDGEEEIEFESPLPAYYHVLLGMSHPPARAQVQPLHRPSIDNDNVDSPSSPTRPSLPTTPSRRLTPSRFGLGIIDEDGEVMEFESRATIEPAFSSVRPPLVRASSSFGGGSPPLPSPPLAGMNSPFWGTYASAMGDEASVKEQHRSLLSRLPIIEETIVESPDEL